MTSAKLWLLTTLLVGACLYFSPTQTLANTNGHSVVLLHGFAGWGRDEMLGIKYWGVLSGDIQERLKSSGIHTVTGAVGPVSSNYDQAVELYAQLTGTRVDYGAKHAAAHGHSRYGRNYTEALLPNWGKLDANGNREKIHIIAHSHGGKTARMLSYLLKNGSPDFDETTNTNPSALLDPNQPTGDWIASVTTLSTPHNGTTLTEGVTEFFPNVVELVASVAAIAGVTDLDNSLYDFKLDQWGLDRESGESFASYTGRVNNSGLWSGNVKDISLWDLSPRGSLEFNEKIPAQDDVYYFSYSTEATYKGWFTNKHYPDVGISGMFVGLYPTAYYMGRSQFNWPNEQLTIGSNWFQNDGIVNTISMAGPVNGSTDTIVNFAGQPQKGIWNHMGVIDKTDHFAIVGLNPLQYSNEFSMGGLVDWYVDWGHYLQGLPN